MPRPRSHPAWRATSREGEFMSPVPPTSAPAEFTSHLRAMYSWRRAPTGPLSSLSARASQLSKGKVSTPKTSQDGSTVKTASSSTSRQVLDTVATPTRCRSEDARRGYPVRSPSAARLRPTPRHRLGTKWAHTARYAPVSRVTQRHAMPLASPARGRRNPRKTRRLARESRFSPAVPPTGFEPVPPP